MFGIFEKIGGYFTNLLADTGAFVTLFIGMFASLRRAAPPWREIVRQSYFVGIESLPELRNARVFSNVSSP
ncbi:hypothetical protein FACS1894139_17810 [Planctomycetales bacterium]|nr:hypothetical protein FACS1894139_17810 [Planctomycetales bacterium]